MSFTNIEIKARTQQPADIRKYLVESDAVFKGIDHQTDTYFHVPRGRLKLRQGNIENALIFYERNDDFGPKQSDFNLVAVADGAGLLQVLENALGVLVVVKKQREIYFINNVKFHIDFIESLGDFVEIEASNKEGEVTIETLQSQCEFFLQAFKIEKEDLINISYSDMLLQRI